MAEYTWDDIIINPKSKEAEDAAGSKVYYSDNPSDCIKFANEDDGMFLGTLKSVEPNNKCGHFYIKEKGCCYDCIIVKKEESYSERAKKWIEENNLKIGDYVKILRKTELYENRWGSFWVDEMSDYIGKVLKVVGINSIDGLIILECDDTSYEFPYFVLEKAEKPESQYVPFESKEEFVRRYTEVKEGADFDTFEDNLFQCGMWLRSKVNGGLFQVVGFLNDAVYLNIRAFDTNYQSMLDEYTFLDGSPCGKEVEDV